MLKKVFLYFTDVKDPYWFAKWNKNNVYDIHLRKNNPIGFDLPCIKISYSSVLFEKYRMALKRDKDAI